MNPGTPDAAVGEKFCSGCEQTKPLSAFGREGKASLGVRGRCRTCEKAKRKRLRARQAEKGSGEWLAVAGCPSARRVFHVGLGGKPHRRERLDIPACTLGGEEHTLAEVMPRERMPADPPADVDLSAVLEVGEAIAEGPADV